MQILAVFAGYFPDCYVEGQGLTPFKVGSEYLIVVIILVAMGLLHRVRAMLALTTYRLLQAMALADLDAWLADQGREPYFFSPARGSSHWDWSCLLK